MKAVEEPVNRLIIPIGIEASALYSKWGLGLFIEPLGQNTLNSCSLSEHCPSSEQNKARIFQEKYVNIFQKCKFIKVLN